MFNYLRYFVNIACGLALFLYGVQQSTQFFRENMGGGFKNMMEKYTKRNKGAFAFGMALSAITQSSTIATTFAIGLVDSGVLPFASSIIVMMGASLGGTFVSFLLNLNIFSLAPFMFASSYFVGACVKKPTAKLVCGFVKPISLIFLGMMMISGGTSHIFQNEAFRNGLLNYVSNPWIMGFAAFCCAGVLQSSSAIMALGISLAAAGALPEVAALPIALGAHIGSTTMVVMAGLSGRLSARKLGVITFIYKFAGGLLFLAILPFVQTGMSKFAVSSADQLVYGQIIIAAFNIVVFYNFPVLLENMAMFFISGEDDPGQPKFLDDDILDVPDIAMELLSREVTRLSNMMEAYFQMLLEPEKRDPWFFAKLPEEITSLSKSCQEYCSKIKIHDNDGRLKLRYASINYTISILRAMSGPLCTMLKDRLSSKAIHLIMADWVGAKLWEAWRLVARQIVRVSLRAFVIGEQGIIDYVKRLSSEFDNISSQVMNKLQAQQFFDRDISLSLRMVSQMQGFLSITKILADVENCIDLREIDTIDELQRGEARRINVLQ